VLPSFFHQQYKGPGRGTTSGTPPGQNNDLFDFDASKYGSTTSKVKALVLQQARRIQSTIATIRKRVAAADLEGADIFESGDEDEEEEEKPDDDTAEVEAPDDHDEETRRAWKRCKNMNKHDAAAAGKSKPAADTAKEIVSRLRHSDASLASHKQQLLKITRPDRDRLVWRGDVPALGEVAVCM
jgi:hypothetical protein